MINRVILYNIVKKHVIRNFHSQLEYIINSVPLEYLKTLDKLLSNKSTSNIICTELDFIATKGRYFGYIQLDKLKYEYNFLYSRGLNFNIAFGMDFNDVPELIEKWRDEKLNKVIKG